MNDEARMTKGVFHGEMVSDLGIRISFVIRHSGFVIPR